MTEWKKTFEFKGKKLYYNRIQYNNPSERAVEVPIGFDFLTANVQESARVLELGNVLSYYENTLSEELGIVSREIIDKFEQGIGIDNKDLMDLEPPDNYDVIVSISTVEHIGQEVAPTGAYGEQTNSRDREAPLKAILKIYDLLTVNGKALITVPFGTLTDFGWYIQFSGQYLALLYNKYGIPKEAVSKTFLKLIDRSPGGQVNMLWEESDGFDVSNCEYGYPFPTANAIAVIELSKVSNDFHLNLNVEPTPLFYHMPYETRIESGQQKAQFHQTQADLDQYKQLNYQTQAQVEIISVHVPTTLGTTFSQILSAVYGNEAVFMDNENVPKSQIKPSDFPPNIKAIHGHFHLDKYNGYFPNAKRVIWLRNPVIRLISNYFFWRAQEAGVPRNMDVLGIVEFAELPGVQNIVGNYIGKNQLSDFYFVGIQEFLESDLEELKMMMEWSELSFPISNLNTLPENEEQFRKILDDGEIVKKLAQSNNLDMELYQEALDLRGKRRNELGGFHQLLQLSEQSKLQLYKAQEASQQSQSQLHQTQTELEQSQSQLHQTQTELEQSQSQLHQAQEASQQYLLQLYKAQEASQQSQSQLHQTQTELEQSQSQLHQTQTELKQSQSQLHQTQTELEQSQSQLHQTQTELEQSQSQLHQTQTELEQSQSQLHQTQTELEQSQSQLHQTRRELKRSQSQFYLSLEDLQQSQSQLHQAQTELALFQAQLYQTEEDLQQSQSQLHQAQTELALFQAQLYQTEEDLQQSQSQSHQAQTELAQSQAQLYQTGKDLQQSQSQLHQIKGEFEQFKPQLSQAESLGQQSQLQLHLTIRELERTRLSQATASQTDQQSQQMQYKLLVWEAWYACQNGDLKQMAQYLRQSLKHTSFSRTETILNWLDSFSTFSSEKGDNFDAHSLTNTEEWKQLMRGILAVKTVSSSH